MEAVFILRDLVGRLIPGLNLYRTDPVQPLATEGEELDELQIDHDPSNL